MKPMLSILPLTLLCMSIHATITPSLLNKALIIGRDSNDQAFFLCRVSLSGALQIGTLSPKLQTCVFTNDGKVYAMSDFTIPDKKEFGLYTWSNNNEHVIKVGSAADGKPLYICQSNFNGRLLVGKTWPGYNHCNVVYKGRELIAELSSVFSSLK